MTGPATYASYKIKITCAETSPEKFLDGRPGAEEISFNVGLFREGLAASLLSVGCRFYVFMFIISSLTNST